MLAVPDFHAASRPWVTGRPCEVYIDASDLAWCVVLCQRSVPGGTPKIIGIVTKSFSDEATRWNAFEREYFAFKEGYDVIRKWVEGFKVFYVLRPQEY